MIKETKVRNSRTDTKTTFAMKKVTKIGYWNTRTMYEAGKLNQVIMEMQRYNLDILGLSEIKWEGFGSLTTKNGAFTLLYSGVEEGENRRNGVGILLTKASYRTLMEWHPVSDRIITAKFKSKLRNVLLIQCYAPTETSDMQGKTDFYSKLKDTISKAKKRDIVIIMGDFNAKVGFDNRGLQQVMGIHGLGERNGNGELLTNFCADHDLVIGGTLFPHKLCHKVTWVSPDQNTENQIDHFAIKKAWRKSLLDVRNKRGADIGSDHHLVVANVRMKILACKRKFEARNKRFDTTKIKEKEVRNQIKLELRNKYQVLSEMDTEDGDVEATWGIVKNTLLDVSQKTMGYKANLKKEWMSDATWGLIEQRQHLKQKRNSCKTRKQKETVMLEYNSVDKSVKTSARRDKRKWVNEVAEQAEVAANKGDTRELYRITRLLSGGKKQYSYPVKSKEGVLLTGEDDQMSRWTEFYQELLEGAAETEEVDAGRGNVSTESDPAMIEPDSEISTACPSLREVKTALKALKTGKSPGKDNICPEILKVDLETTTHLLHPLIKKIWSQEKVPGDWKRGLITKIPKKGDRTQCRNWRGISLLSVPGKVLSTIILNRIEGALEKKLRREQAGFRRNRSCVDHINTLRIIVEQSLEWNSTLYLMFIDFEQAFDSLVHSNIWNVLRKYGIPPKIVSIIQDMYNGYTCQVIHNGKLSEPINVTSGVRQGCVLSPLLFLVVLDDVMRRASRTKRGIRWTLMEVLGDLDYADDLCFLTQRFSDMQEKVEALCGVIFGTGLKINVSKTKELRINARTTRQMTVGGENVESVDKFLYLGSIISGNGGSDEDVLNRINKANTAFINLYPIWRSQCITTKTKLKIFRSVVKAILLYGSETWRWNTFIQSRLQTFINRCLRKIYKIYWPETIRNNALWELSEEEPIGKQIRRRKWRWIGHTLRKPADAIERQALDWNPQGQRGRGRPRGTWRRSVYSEIEECGMAWKEVKATAGNRTRWKVLTDALCSTEERQD